MVLILRAARTLPIQSCRGGASRGTAALSSVSEISARTIKRLVQQPGAELFLLWTGSPGINGRYIPHKTFFSSE